MEAFQNSLLVTTLIAVCTATASAQNSPAAQGARAGSAVTDQRAGGERDAKRPHPSGAIPMDRPTATAPQLILGPTAGSATQTPADGGITRGGPDNPSGLKKPQ
jgi:hypothetical protein